MYDPQTIQLIVLFVLIAFFVIFFLTLFYGLFLLTKIRSQAVKINKSLDLLLAKSEDTTAPATGPKSL